jgi:multiple antibiotic resistance protein
VLLAGQAGADPMRHAILFGVILIVCLACFIVFLIAGRLARWLGITGNVVLSRLLGVLLAALAVQFVIDGVKAVIG